MPNTFNPTVYQQNDPENSERTVWVRIRPGEDSIIIEVFREQPDANTSIQRSIALLEFGPCYENQSKILLWKEHEDPAKDDGTELILVNDIDNWQPQPERES